MYSLLVMVTAGGDVVANPVKYETKSVHMCVYSLFFKYWEDTQLKMDRGEYRVKL